MLWPWVSPRIGAEHSLELLAAKEAGRGVAGRFQPCPSLDSAISCWNQGPVVPHPHPPAAVPGSLPARPPTTWHRDPGEGLRLAQRVHLGVPERLAHGALQVPATQGAASERLGLGGPALPRMDLNPAQPPGGLEPSCEGQMAGEWQVWGRRAWVFLSRDCP